MLYFQDTSTLLEELILIKTRKVVAWICLILEARGKIYLYNNSFNKIVHR